jgi:hypothetical protein
MIIEIGDKLVSAEVLEEEFVCNLSACKGVCCVEGNDGAPLSQEEVNLLEEHIDEIKPYLDEKGLEVIEKRGVFYLDRENEPVTSLVNGRECVFVSHDENGITKCGIEDAYRDKKIDFNKPVSCHLYPIRVKEYRSFTALNYDRWHICSDACTLGKELQTPVYKFLKGPLIRVYGEEFYQDLERAAAELKKQQSQ